MRASVSEGSFGLRRELSRTAAEEEGVDLIDADAVEVDSFDCHIKALGLEFFFDSKDFAQGTSLFGVSHFEGEGQESEIGRAHV